MHQTQLAISYHSVNKEEEQRKLRNLMLYLSKSNIDVNFMSSSKVSNVEQNESNSFHTINSTQEVNQLERQYDADQEEAHAQASEQ